jgi:UDP-glucose 4-epimerase
MTRFLLSLEQAIDTIMAAYSEARRGEIFIPIIPASLITNIAKALIGNRDIETKFIGIRPGEKVHEILVAEDEAYRTITRGNYYVIKPILPELDPDPNEPSAIQGEYSSKTSVMDFEQTRQLLKTSKLMIEDVSNFEELLR